MNLDIDGNKIKRKNKKKQLSACRNKEFSVHRICKNFDWEYYKKR